MRKTIWWPLVALMVILSLAACGTKPAPSQTPVPQPQQQPVPSKTTEAAFHGAYPYPVPPIGHFNTFVTNNLSLGIYYDLLEAPMGFYYWSTGQYMPIMATLWETKEPNQFVVKLRTGAKWSDGREFTADDVVTTFTIGKFFQWVVWRYIGNVSAPDKYTVIFEMSRPSTVVERYVLRERVRSHAVYGEWARQMTEVMTNDPKLTSDEAKKLRSDFEQFRPERMVTSGPFQFDHNAITEAEISLVKNPNAWNANNVLFDKILLYNGESSQSVTPMLMNKQADYATHGFPPATERAFQQAGIRIMRPPLYSGPALYVNHKIYPLNRMEVRQAFAHAINRAENGVVSLGESGVGIIYMAGFSDNMLKLWLPDDAIGTLNKYEYDVAKAEAILTGIGFKKGSDGIWIDDQGQKMAYELIVPAEFPDWSAAAENAAHQLSKFGINVTVRAVPAAQQPTDVRESRFQLAIQAWGAGVPHPHFSFTNLVNYTIQAPNGVGTGFDLNKAMTKSFGEVDFEELIVKSAEGLDVNSQKEHIAKLSLAYNEVLPIIPLWERYGNNPVVENVRVTGWPNDDDPIWSNSAYSDSFVVLMLLEGRLKPVAR